MKHKLKTIGIALFLLCSIIGSAYMVQRQAMNIQKVQVTAGDYPLVFLASATNDSYSTDPIDLGIATGNKTLFLQVENLRNYEVTGLMTYEIQNNEGIDSLTEIEINGLGCSLSGDIIYCNETKTFNAGSITEFEKVITISPYSRGTYNISIAIE